MADLNLAASGVLGSVSGGAVIPTRAVGLSGWFGPILWSGNTIYAASPALADVQAAIASASPGDTVRVPAGSATWASGLSITKGVLVIGAGIGQTNITMSAIGGVGWAGRYAVSYDPANWALNSPFRFSGFTFNLGALSCGFSLGRGNLFTSLPIQDKVRIDHNRFYNPATAYTAQGFFNYCEMYGSVDNNIFSGMWYPVKNDSQGGPNFLWDTSPNNIWEPGTNQSLYYEDNLWEMVPDPGNADNGFTDGQYSARYVYRYNDITGMRGYCVMDLHAHNGSDMGSCFGCEVYGNDITGTAGWPTNLLLGRSGKSMVFGNNSGGAGSYSCNFYQTSNGADLCPTLSPELQITHDTYCFQNRNNLNGTLAPITADTTVYLNCAGLIGIPTLGRDAMSENTTPGVSSGPLASRPATPAPHQGYWATDQSTTDLTGRVGVNPATPLSGTLYYCKTAGVWTDSYTPYAYPHPLRSDPIVGD